MTVTIVINTVSIAVARGLAWATIDHSLAARIVQAVKKGPEQGVSEPGLPLLARVREAGRMRTWGSWGVIFLPHGKVTCKMKP